MWATRSQSLSKERAMSAKMWVFTIWRSTAISVLFLQAFAGKKSRCLVHWGLWSSLNSYSIAFWCLQGEYSSASKMLLYMQRRLKLFERGFGADCWAGHCQSYSCYTQHSHAAATLQPARLLRQASLKWKSEVSLEQYITDHKKICQ